MAYAPDAPPRISYKLCATPLRAPRRLPGAAPNHRLDVSGVGAFLEPRGAAAKVLPTPLPCKGPKNPAPATSTAVQLSPAATAVAVLDFMLKLLDSALSVRR